MTKKEILGKIKILKQQLQLIQTYPEAFEEFYGGKKEVAERIDEILDEVVRLRKQLKGQ